MENTTDYKKQNIEVHPLTPFINNDSKVLLLGTFPPAKHRWCMNFFYPNFQNDMWRIMGLLFYNNKEHFVVKDEKSFDKKRIMEFLKEKHIAIFDTATKVIRTQNTASDKDLLIVEETDIQSLLQSMPLCNTIITAGQLATTTLCRQLNISEPKVGQYEIFINNGHSIKVFRMPSSSRAYPMSIEKKTEQYKLALMTY